MIYSYCSDIGDRQGHDQSVSPVPAVNQPTICLSEADAINNNNNIDNTTPRRTTLSRSPRQEITPTKLTQTKNSTSLFDARLNDWLIKNGIDLTSRNMILNEMFTYEDFVYEMEKVDLLRIGLK